MPTFGIIANAQRDPAVACARELFECLSAAGVAVRFHPDLAGRGGPPSSAATEEEVAQSDVILALGGDGTLLAAHRVAARHGTPILGIHLGGPASFGFLTEMPPENACAAALAVAEGRYRVEERLMVSAEVVRGGEPVHRHDALNDIVLRAQARMLKMRVTVNETYIATYAADGIIVATPTGSTAYNLAAGGPLVFPGVDTILLTPICPHTLNVRTLLVGVDDVIHVRVESGDRDTNLLTADGQVSFQAAPGDEIAFRRSALRARFISLDGADFYQKVQRRYRLGERFGNS
ncbi:MAG: NAD(+)/NADH kinase [Armatimonadota bacterium]